MSKKHILIFDDAQGTRDKWRDDLQTIKLVRTDYEVKTINEQEFKDALVVLEERKRMARKGKTSSEPNPIDNVSLLVIDYDLLDLGLETSLTAEHVAYLARCYSTCGIILIINQFVNQFGPDYFDLTLTGHPESFGDLNLPANQLVISGLWEEPFKGFRPWSWPILPRAVTTFEQRVTDIKDHLDDAILNFLGIPNDVTQIMPRSTREFLSKRENPVETTFREFVSQSGNGFRRKDQAIDDSYIARIAAARISVWLETVVLPGQDILVDAPHLVSRFPSLLRRKPQNITSWNETCSLGGATTVGIRSAPISKFKFARDHWLSRPAWFWRDLSNCEDIQDVKEPWSTERPGYVFCEDVSAFLPREAAREFVADLPSQFARRFVVDPSSEKAAKFSDDLSSVNYRPSVRLSM